MHNVQQMQRNLYLYYKKLTKMKVKNFLLVEEIGSGSFSTVFKAIDAKDPSKIYAIKSMRQIPQNEEKAVRKQIALLKQIQQKHVKNVVNYVTDFNEKNKWYIVFEYCGKGDLQNYLKKQGTLPENFCKNVASSTIEALSQLHQKGIAHRDLKLSNILINDDYDFKIADFGMAKIQQDGILQSYCGTPYAMAPQVLKRQSYDTKCDTWSLGIMIYQLVYGKLPFDGRKHGGGVFGLTTSVLQQQPNYNPAIKVSQDCISFMKLCLKKNPKDRPTMKQLSSHPWLSVGVSSVIRKDMLKKTFEGKQTNDQIPRRIKQVINQSVQDHIKKLIKHNRLGNIQIGNLMSIFDKYYKDEANVKMMAIFMIAKIVKEIKGSNVVIEIEKNKLSSNEEVQMKQFPIKLTKIEIFKNHLKNLQSLLQQYISKLPQKRPLQANIQRQIISFVINQAESCLSFNQNYPDKISLIQYLSKLPIYAQSNSTVYIKWAFNQTSFQHENTFNEILQQLTEQDVYKYVNQPSIGEKSQEKSWIIQNQFPKERRPGTQIQLGEYISRVIQINCGYAGDNTDKL